MWTCVEPFWYNSITIFGRLAGSSQIPISGCLFAQASALGTSHTKSLQMHYVSGWSPFMVMVLEVLGFKREGGVYKRGVQWRKSYGTHGLAEKNGELGVWPKASKCTTAALIHHFFISHVEHETLFC